MHIVSPHLKYVQVHRSVFDRLLLRITQMCIFWGLSISDLNTSTMETLNHNICYLPGYEWVRWLRVSQSRGISHEYL
jgi:hypothetical protein